MTVALFPGSFDPFHNGHLEVVERAGHLFDEVVVATLRNPQKAEPLFSLEEREEMLRDVLEHLDNVRMVSVATLVVNVARDIGATAIIRGLRAVSDFENELQMAQMNRQLSGIDTCSSRPARPRRSSPRRCLREVARYGGDVSAFVPKVVAVRLEKKFADERRSFDDELLEEERDPVTTPRAACSVPSTPCPRRAPCRCRRRCSSIARTCSISCRARSTGSPTSCAGPGGCCKERDEFLA